LEISLILSYDIKIGISLSNNFREKYFLVTDKPQILSTNYIWQIQGQQLQVEIIWKELFPKYLRIILQNLFCNNSRRLELTLTDSASTKYQFRIKKFV
jgi:hypothetical protein